MATVSEHAGFMRELLQKAVAQNFHPIVSGENIVIENYQDLKPADDILYALDFFVNEANPFNSDFGLTVLNYEQIAAVYFAEDEVVPTVGTFGTSGEWTKILVDMLEAFKTKFYTSFNLGFNHNIISNVMKVVESGKTNNIVNIKTELSEVFLPTPRFRPVNGYFHKDALGFISMPLRDVADVLDGVIPSGIVEISKSLIKSKTVVNKGYGKRLPDRPGDSVASRIDPREYS
jgi:hypothetical protein